MTLRSQSQPSYGSSGATCSALHRKFSRATFLLNQAQEYHLRDHSVTLRTLLGNDVPTGCFHDVLVALNALPVTTLITTRSPPSQPPCPDCLVVVQNQMFPSALPRMAYKHIDCQGGSHVSECPPGASGMNEPSMCTLKRKRSLRELRHQPFTLIDRQGIVEHDGTLTTSVGLLKLNI